MTTAIKITNTGHYPVVANVWETNTPRDEGQTVERHELKPGESTPDITIYNWRRGVTILEVDPGT